MKNENKIRKLLGKEYHLSTGYGWENDEYKCTKWVLFRWYKDSDVYFSSENKAIMDSDNNTEEELLEYAKKHHKIDEHEVMSYIRMGIAWVLAILAILNIFIQNQFLRHIILPIDLILIIEMYISHYIWNKNWKVNMLELKEDIEKQSEKIENELRK